MSRVRTTLLVGAVAISLGTALTACGGSGSAKSIDPVGQCKSDVKLKVGVVTSPPKSAQASPWVAQDLGYFKKDCLDVKLQLLNTGVATLQALQSGSIDIAVSTPLAVFPAIAKGSPLTDIGSPASVLPQEILATSEVKQCSDLKGKKVGTGGPGDLVDFLVGQYAKSCGLELNKDVKVLVGAPGDFGPQLAQNTIQASALHADDDALVETQYGVKLNVLAKASDFVPDMQFQTLTVKKSYLANKVNKEIATRFVAAVLEANKFLVNPANHDKTISELAKVTTRAASVVTVSVENYISTLPTSCSDMMTEKRVSFTVDFMQKQKLLDKALSYDDVFAKGFCDGVDKLATS